ncbi:response regulator transcription factor [Streptomyces albus]|uniref:response regulator transcription factor n=1 Tax=Streptomyces albus TaxID=1888 RepID=UPI0033FD585C
MESRGRDYEQLLAVAVRVLESWGQQSPWPAVAEAFAECLDVEVATVTQIERGGARPLTWMSGGLSGQQVRELSRQSVRARNPLIGHYRTQADPCPRTPEEVIGRAAWDRSPAREVARNFTGAGHMLAVPSALTGSAQRGLVLYSDAPFSLARRAFAHRAQPLLAAIDAHDRALVHLREAGPRRAEDNARSYGLTPRELTVLTLLSQALPAKTIAARLGISVRTVQTHVQRVYKKLGTRDRMETCLLARNLGLTGDGPAPAPDA